METSTSNHHEGTAAHVVSTYAPFFPPSFGDEKTLHPAPISAIISSLKMLKHPEGGYFVETDRDPRRVPNPFLDGAAARHIRDQDANMTQKVDEDDEKNKTRNASTTIFYLLTPKTNYGAFHRNSGRTVHTLHKGRGRYVIIHADEARDGGMARVESFVVGQDIAKGERLQWVVEGGKFKSSWLLPDVEDGLSSEEGLLISETVIPGFEFSDHDFMRPHQMERLVMAKEQEELAWLLKRD